ncbi:MAG: peptidase M24 [Deltaproteobacteria bacterium HGW-Deltaproteobacteria-21]|nr:MAG: peptidase M24 [Deltaproteobacteria bacterium HGW-Deltaproteobacteria-21]
MKREILRNRIRALREKLKNLKQDTIWVLQPENRRYLSGFKAQDLLFTESSGSLLITEKSALLLTDSRYTLEAEREAVDFEVVTLRKGLIESLPGLLSDLGTRHLGFEEGYVTWEAHKRILLGMRKLATRPKLTPLKGLIEDMREIKDPEEIRFLEASGDLMSKILAGVIPRIKPGRVEKEIAWEIEDRARQGGAEGLAFPSIVASGPNSALPHATPTTRKIREGEPITLDVGVRVEGYCCDMTRTIFLGKPKPEFAKMYRIVRAAQLAAMEKVLPGAESTAVDGTAREMIRDEGYGEYFGHSLGHGVGLEPHERPRLGPRNPVELKEGMVVTVEPGIYLPGKGGVRLEHMVLITKKGPRILTRDDHFYDF